MYRVAFIILHTVIAQATSQDSVDSLTDKLVNRLVDRVKKTDMDKTTLAKTHEDKDMSPAMKPRIMAMSVPTMQMTLQAHGMNSGPLEKLALTSIGATRDVSMAAQVKQAFSSLDFSTQEKFATVRAEAMMKRDEFENDMAGSGFFDPVGWMTQMPDASTLLFLREANLKNGRLAMIASLGMIVGNQYQPWIGGDIPHFSTLAQLGTFQPTNYETFWAATFVACGFVELWASINPNQDIQEGWSLTDEPVPGNIGWDPLNFNKDLKAFKGIQDKELKNGRLAMFAAAGMLAQQMVAGQKVVMVAGHKLPTPEAF